MSRILSAVAASLLLVVAVSVESVCAQSSRPAELDKECMGARCTEFAPTPLEFDDPDLFRLEVTIGVIFESSCYSPVALEPTLDPCAGGKVWSLLAERNVQSGVVGDTVKNARSKIARAVKVVESNYEERLKESLREAARSRHPVFEEEGPDLRYQVDQQIDQTLPEAVGGDPPLRYELSPLPDGLGLASPTGPTGRLGLTGTPTDPQAEKTHSLTVTDADGDTATLGLTITVFREESGPVFREEEELDLRYQVDQQIDQTLPKAVGGDPPLRYELSPSLPDGLVFNAAAGEVRLTGTPTDPQAEKTYSLTVTDADSDMATLGLTITVVEDQEPDQVPAPDQVPDPDQEQAGPGQGALHDSVNIDTMPQQISSSMEGNLVTLRFRMGVVLQLRCYYVIDNPCPSFASSIRRMGVHEELAQESRNQMGTRLAKFKIVEELEKLLKAQIRGRLSSMSTPPPSATRHRQPPATASQPRHLPAPTSRDGRRMLLGTALFAGGGVLSASKNEWVIDEGYVGVGVAVVGLAFVLKELVPEWRGLRVESSSSGVSMSVSW